MFLECLRKKTTGAVRKIFDRLNFMNHKIVEDRVSRFEHTPKFPGFPGSYLNFPDYLRTPPAPGRGGYLAPLALRIYYPDTVFFAGAYGATISSISKSGLRAANCWNRTIFVIQVSSFESNHTPRNKNLRFVNGIAVACCSVNSEFLVGVVNLCFFQQIV